MYSRLEDAKAKEAQLAAAQAASGRLPAPPAPWKGLPPPIPPHQLLAHTTLSALSSMGSARPDPAAGTLLTAASSLTRGEGVQSAEQSLHSTQQLQRSGSGREGEPMLTRSSSTARPASPGAGTDTAPHSLPPHAGPHSTHGKSRLGGGASAAAGASGADSGARAEPLSLAASHAEIFKVLARPPAPARPSFAMAASGPDFLAHSALEPLRPMAFSAAALQQLSLGLGVKGITLQVCDVWPVWMGRACYGACVHLRLVLLVAADVQQGGKRQEV